MYQLSISVLTGYQGKHEEPGSVWLGFCVRGVVVFDVHKDVKTAIHHCAWRKTNNISYAVRNEQSSN